MPIEPTELVPRPPSGRVFEGARRVRLGDVSPTGRLRLDAIVRYLQDVSADDTADAALPDSDAWVVRRTVVHVERFPSYLEPLALATWCSGTGGHWAERRVSIHGTGGGSIEAATLWVRMDFASGRPTRIDEGFHEIYGEAHSGRKVKARLRCGPPPVDGERRSWPLRFTDFDVLEHVNNAAYWEVVEEARSELDGLDAPLRVEFEHARALERHEIATYVVDRRPDGTVGVWVEGDGQLAASAELSSPR